MIRGFILPSAAPPREDGKPGASGGGARRRVGSPLLFGAFARIMKAVEKMNRKAGKTTASAAREENAGQICAPEPA